MTTSDVEEFYKLTPDQAERLVKDLRPCGEYLRRGNWLYARPDVEKAIKEGVHRA